MPPRIFMVPGGTSPYVLEAQRELPEAERIRFQLRTLTPAEWARATDVAGVDKDLWQGMYGLSLLHAGLRGWQGPGAPPWTCDATGAPTEAAIANLSPDVRGELARAVYRFNTVGDVELGKS